MKSSDLPLFDDHSEHKPTASVETALDASEIQVPAEPAENNEAQAIEQMPSISDAATLIAHIETLPGDEGLAYARSHKDKILSTATTEDIWCILFPEDSVTTRAMMTILNALQPAQATIFATENQEKIKHIQDLSCYLTALPNAARVDFAKAHTHLIVSTYELRIVITVLPIQERLSYL